MYLYELSCVKNHCSPNDTLAAGKFTTINVNTVLYQITADYKKFSVFLSPYWKMGGYWSL
jgi:hypothetical protein